MTRSLSRENIEKLMRIRKLLPKYPEAAPTKALDSQKKPSDSVQAKSEVDRVVENEGNILERMEKH